MRVSALSSLLACAVLLAAGCGGSPQEPFTIGVLSDCYGFESGTNELNVASAELPLMELGARLAGRDPSDGVGPVAAAGRDIRLAIGCVAGVSEVIPEARRLVEEEGAQAVVGPLDPAEGIALVRYARRRPQTDFLIEPSAAPEVTLVRPAANVFRFTLDAAQANAGLGGYAYERLGWRKAAVVGDDVPYAWAQAAGFVAEFCALGGRVVQRLWVPFGVDPSSAASRVRPDVDGVYVARAILPMELFLKRYAELGHELPTHTVASATIVDDPAVHPLPAGVVIGGSPAGQQTPPERAHRQAFARAFPGLEARESLTSTSLAYYVGVKAVLKALDDSGGETGRRFRHALATLRLDSPAGPIRLDRDRQAVAPVYVSRFERGGIRTVREVPAVEHTFAGYFAGAGSPPGKASPSCVRRTPPPWAR